MDAGAALAAFDDDFANQYLPIEITPGLIAMAMQLARAHALRGYDAVQLAAAMEVNQRWVAAGQPPITLVSADTALNLAALAEGLVVEDPNDHP
jgi:hypothetical protein